MSKTIDKSNSPQVSGAFLQLMQNHRSGGALNDIAEAMAKVTEGVMDTGKPGKVVITLKFTPASEGEDAAVVVQDEVLAKVPQEPSRASIFFADSETFALSRDNPRQMKLPLKVVEGGVQEESLKKVS